MNTYLILLFLLQATFSFDLKNHAKNPSFETQKSGQGENVPSGWEYKNCERVSTDSFAGKYSIHCKGKDSHIIQWISTIDPGMRYNLTCRFKLKGLAENGYFKITAGSSNWKAGLYPTSQNIKQCKSGTCNDKWYYLTSGASQMNFHSSQYTLSAGIDGSETGEYWIDDIRLEPIVENYLYGVDVVSWRQEVYEDPVEVRVATSLWESMFEDGKHLRFKMTIFNEKNEEVQESEKFMLWDNMNQIVVSM